MKVHPKGLLSKEQKMQTDIWLCAFCKNPHYTVHEFGTIVNNRNIKQVKKTKKLLGKLCACKLRTIIQFWLRSIRSENYYEYAS